MDTPTHPIHHVPHEVLSKNFSHCTSGWTESSNRRPWPRPHPVLPRVNRAWRIVAASTRALWTSIFIRIDANQPHLNTKALSTKLARSGSLPLQVTIVHDRRAIQQWDINEVLSILVPHCARWEWLYLGLYWEDAQEVLDATARLGGLPMLEDYVLNCENARRDDYDWLDEDTDGEQYPTISLSLCPKLSRASFYSTAGFIVNEDDPPYPLETIEDSFDCTLMDCLHVIQNSPKLRSLAAVCETYQPDFDPEDPIFTNSIITELKISLYPSDYRAWELLDRLALPSLKLLHLYGSIQDPSEEYSDSVVEFVRRSSAPLEDLHVVVSSNIHRMECLLLAPKLQKFTASLVATDDVLDLLTCKYPPSDPRAGSGVVPYLEHIELQCDSEVDSSRLNDMVLSRWGGPSGRFKDGRLRSMYFLCKDNILSAELKQCTEEGLEVDALWTRIRGPIFLASDFEEVSGDGDLQDNE